jgi:hypothetical protein
LMPENLNDYTDFEETGNLVSSEKDVYEKIPTSPIVSEYEHAIKSDSDEDSASSDEDPDDASGREESGDSDGKRR